MNVGLGTVNKCSWIEKESSRELVQQILEPFATCYPSSDMYPPTGIENFTMADWLILVYTYKIIVSKESIMEVPIFEIFNHAESLRRHKYYLKSLIKNSTKISSQFLSNRVIRCWNSLPAEVFPVKPSSAAFKNRLLSCDLNHFLVLTSTNYYNSVFFPLSPFY
ncbi:hypothetical protein B9Z55_014607 [Caenorhabditis nigoni]|uniref:Uncharacterized protein n=1 Tax=Caenorhabditis nigoni TaxID=1611254 RepID=A0A2G5U6J4_9PELO|nr:hypothetical protein B9Z55_014607 [Caenorhabditis nigoni]